MIKFGKYRWFKIFEIDKHGRKHTNESFVIKHVLTQGNKYLYFITAILYFSLL